MPTPTVSEELFALSDEQQEIRRLCREFAAREIRPVSLATDETDVEWPVDVWRKAAALGLTPFMLPEAYGGVGLTDCMTGCLVQEERRSAARTIRHRPDRRRRSHVHGRRARRGGANGIALPVVVVDDSGYGEIRAEMMERGDPPLGVDLPSPDFPPLARSLGCEGRSVNDADALARALDSALAADRPTLAHVRDRG